MYKWKCKFCGRELKNDVMNKSDHTVHFQCDMCKESFDIPINKLNNKAIK